MALCNISSGPILPGDWKHHTDSATNQTLKITIEHTTVDHMSRILPEAHTKNIFRYMDPKSVQVVFNPINFRTRCQHLYRSDCCKCESTYTLPISLDGSGSVQNEKDSADYFSGIVTRA